MDYKLFKHKQYFITAIGTDMGKTYFVTKLYDILLQSGQKANIIKPVISGFGLNNDNDTMRILKSLNLEVNYDNINKISPFRLKLPLSPDIAAKKENIILDFNKIADFCLKNIIISQKNDEFLLIEGAGGVMSPVVGDKTFLDLMRKLQIPVLLVVGNYLGSISHILTAIKALQEYDINLDYIILNFREGGNAGQRVEFLKSLQNFTDHKIIIL